MKITKKQPLRPRGRSEDKRQSTKNVIRDAYIMVRSKITAIRAEKSNMVVFCMDDGSEIVKRWTDRSRAESWTPEMKEKARQRALQARRKKE